MPSYGNQWFASAGAAAFYSYQIQKSVRIDKADQSYLQYPTGMSSTNNTKYSLSFWVKRGQISISQAVVTGSSGGCSVVESKTSGTHFPLHSPQGLNRILANGAASWR